MLSFLLHTPLLSLLLGPIVTAIGNWGQSLIPLYDKRSAIVKQAIAVVMGFVLVGIAQVVPGSVPTACGSVTASGLTDACIAGLSSATFVTAILTGLVAIAVKHGQQATAKK